MLAFDTPLVCFVDALDTSSLNAVRSALEEALGVRFEGERGAAFYRSTLVQTLFYGVGPTGTMYPPTSGTTSSAAIRSSRSGSPTVKRRFWIALYTPRRSSTSRTRQGG